MPGIQAVMDEQQASDLHLWIALRNGDKAALDLLYSKYIASLYNFGKKICYDHDQVKDCIQDLFVELWQQQKNISLPSNSRLYLFKSLRYKILLHTKRQTRYSYLPYIKAEIMIPSFEQNLIESQLSDSQKKALKQALEKLSARQREALVLRFYEGMSCEEVASVMNVKPQSVYNLIHQSILILKNNINTSLILAEYLIVIYIYCQIFL
jgi:RNA polymerase sigma factor (sigma-70 family)